MLLSAPDAGGAIAVETGFPGGSGVVEGIDPETRTVRIRPADHPGRGWRCWWYVRLMGLDPGAEVTLDVGDAPWATPDRATFSSDGGTSWRHTAAGRREGKRVRYTFVPGAGSVLVAWGPPFVAADAERLVDRLADASPHATAFSLCETREGHGTPALRVSETEAGGRPLVWVQARQHAWESGSSWVAKGFAQWVVSDAPEAVALRHRFEVVVVPVMDIDNVERGAGGKNQEPQDHNRDWSAKPHWRAVAAAQKHLRAAADEGRLAAFVDLHNPAANDRSPFFYIPPREVMSGEAAERMVAFLAHARAEITGPLAFTGRTVASGVDYDPSSWLTISKNWVARLGTPAVAVTFEVSWNTPQSTAENYMTVGRQLGKALARCDE